MAQNDTKNLNDIISDYLLNDKMSDVTLVVDHHIYPAHRFILGANSEVFHRMLYGDMKESHQKQVVIKGVSADTFSLFLQYIYSANNSELTDAEQAMDVLRLAHQYQINDIVKQIEKSLTKLLSFSNVCSVYCFAIFYELNGLTESCVKYVSENIYELLNEETFIKSPIKELKKLLTYVKYPIYCKPLIIEAFKAIRNENPNEDLECIINLVPLERYTIQELIDDIRPLNVLNSDNLFMIIKDRTKQQNEYIMKQSEELAKHNVMNKTLNDSNANLKEELKTYKINYEKLNSQFSKYREKHPPKHRANSMSFR